MVIAEEERETWETRQAQMNATVKKSAKKNDRGKRKRRADRELFRPGRGDPVYSDRKKLHATKPTTAMKHRGRGQTHYGHASRTSPFGKH